ncbi:MAG: hypothetical protein IKL24_05435 [Clostridia bacterium]|nr:hypothetical protein [Clostridia bacterium]
MKKSYALWSFCGFAFTGLIGTLLHFLYDWTGGSIFSAPFSGVNESTWEHMKLLYFPLLIFALLQSIFFRDVRSFPCIKLWGIFWGLLAIPILFYTINGAFGKTPDWMNITIFFVSAAIAFLLETYLFKKDSVRCAYRKKAWVVIIFIGLLFVIFTFYPPKIPLFKDPVDGFYGRPH